MMRSFNDLFNNAGQLLKHPSAKINDDHIVQVASEDDLEIFKILTSHLPPYETESVSQKLAQQISKLVDFSCDAPTQAVEKIKQLCNYILPSSN